MKRLNFIFILLLFFVPSIFAQQNPYPNELKDYEFFGKGKLKDLQFAASSKDDVKKIFGVNCEKQCDYDGEWSIRFEYYEAIWIIESRNENDVKLTYLLDSKYLGKLRSIEIRPKKQLSFSGISFPDQFQRFLLTSTAPFQSDFTRSSGDEAFRDLNGLTYEIISETIKYDYKNKKSRSFNKGDLVLIRYDIPKELKKTLFVLQK